MSQSEATQSVSASASVSGIGCSDKLSNVLISEMFPPKRGGSARWFYEIYKRQTDAIAVVTDQLPTAECDTPNQSRSFIKRCRFQLSDTGGLTPWGMLGYLKLLVRIRRALGSQKVARIQVARVLPEGWLALIWRIARGPRFDCFAHGEEINLEGAVDGGVMSSRQHRIMARLVFCFCETVIANTENTARMLREQWKIPDERIQVIHPGVDAAYFVPAAFDPEVRQRLGWGDAPVLLTVGRLQARKGHDHVIQALPRIIRTIPHLIYAIVGDGEERPSLEKKAQLLGVEQSIRWYPACSDEEMLKMYQQCNLFILANRQIGSDVEGFGMVLLEAAACGKATIAGRSGGTAEAIVDFETGRLVDGTQPEAIADLVTELLGDQASTEAMGIAGRKRVVRMFDWPILAAKVQETLRRQSPD